MTSTPDESAARADPAVSVVPGGASAPGSDAAHAGPPLDDDAALEVEALDADPVPDDEPATDDAALSVLRRVLGGGGSVDEGGAPAAEVPDDVVAAAKALFTWRTVDAELATLSYDSLLGDGAVAVRSAGTAPRVLTFSTARLDLEVELVDGRLAGQLLPGSETSLAAAHLDGGSVEVADASGPVATVDVDELGCFSLDAVPAGPVRIVVRTPHAVVTTDWTRFDAG